MNDYGKENNQFMGNTEANTETPCNVKLLIAYDIDSKRRLFSKNDCPVYKVGESVLCNIENDIYVVKDAEYVVSWASSTECDTQTILVKYAAGSGKIEFKDETVNKALCYVKLLQDMFEDVDDGIYEMLESLKSSISNYKQ